MPVKNFRRYFYSYLINLEKASEKIYTLGGLLILKTWKKDILLSLYPYNDNEIEFYFGRIK